MEWEDEKFHFCMTQWRNITGFSGGRFVLESDEVRPSATESNKDQQPSSLIPFIWTNTVLIWFIFTSIYPSRCSDQTRDICDRDVDTHCWMAGKSNVSHHSQQGLIRGFHQRTYFSVAGIPFDTGPST
jgi:hypothetical protein